MWIILNPKKAHRFTTKGINLHRSAPTAFVDPNIGAETMAAITRAIADGQLIRVAGNKMDGLVIPKQAKISTVDTEDTETQAHIKHIRDEEGRVLSTVIVMPDEDGNAVEGEAKQTGVIMTGITQSDRDEDEDEEEG